MGQPSKPVNVKGTPSGDLMRRELQVPVLLLTQMFKVNRTPVVPLEWATDPVD